MRIGSSELESFLQSQSVYVYRYVEGPLIMREHVDLILEAAKQGKQYIDITLDLGHSISRIEIRKGLAIIEGSSIPIEELNRTVEEGFSLQDNRGIHYKA
jgi:hypothetical protein